MTKRLSEAQFQNAAKFIREQARPLDRSLFEFHFESGSASAVSSELAKFQNDDNGFGHALEPDFRLTASSPMATTVAFQYLREIGATSSDELVKQGITYFANTYDTEFKGWHSTPKSLNDQPHAPWWHHNEDSGSAVDSMGWANPNAEIVAYLHEFTDLVPAILLAEVTVRARQDVIALSDDVSVHSMLCYLRMAQSAPQNLADTTIEKMKRAAELGTASDPAWPGRGSKLEAYAPTPDSSLADVLGKAMSQHLDDRITDQGEDGSWSPNWAWGQYENDWEVAKREWKGYITVQMLKVLRAYGRI